LTLPRFTGKTSAREASFPQTGPGEKQFPGKDRPTKSYSLKPMKKHLLLFGLLTVTLCAILGCATSVAHRLNRLELGMSQAQVKNVLGDDYIAKASATDTNGSRLQMWEYTDKETKEPYRVYFKDGQLAQWGQNGRLDFPELNLPK
jgi:hypothetical protein